MLKRLLIMALFALLLSACEEKTEYNAGKSSEKDTAPTAADANSTTPADKKKTNETSADEPAAVDQDSKKKEPAKHAPLTTDYIIAANQLAGMDAAAAEKLLGKPEKAEKINFRYAGTTTFVPAVTNYYMQGQAAVTFVENVAARIVYTPKDDISFDEELPKALEQAGIPGNAEPLDETGTAAIFENLAGIFSVTAYKKAELVDYLYIVLEEKYK